MHHLYQVHAMVKKMKFQDIEVPAPGFGWGDCTARTDSSAMGLSFAYGKADDSVSMRTLETAVDIGCTFWDTAVVYGRGHNEKLLGDFIREHKCRDKIFLASKCGFAVSVL